MQIKRFEAKNMTAALSLIKTELGTDAVILSARSIKTGSGILGTLKYSGVEVTAASDGHVATEDHLHDDLVHDDLGRHKAYKAADPSPGHLRESTTRRTQARAGDAAAISKAYRNKRSNLIVAGKKYLLALHQHLISQGVDADITADLTERLKLIPNFAYRLADGESETLICSLLESMGLGIQLIQFDSIKPQPIVFIGTSGVGKTTTVAKLAAHFAIAGNKAVAMITFDDVRIGALEQIRLYARIMGIPLAVASNLSVLKKHLKRFKDKDLVLIDTPGLNPQKSAQIRELQRLFEKLPSLQTQLVLSATTKETDLIDSIKRLEGFRRRRLIFTRLDETSAAGNLLNVMVRTHIPVSYISDGPQIPDDIRPASLQKLVRMLVNDKTAPYLRKNVLLSSDSDKGMVRSTQSIAKDRQVNFVANRNSDVYHVAGCKWTQRIKHENMITFESSAAAAHQNYLPCRNCNPDRDTKTDARVFEGDHHMELNVSTR